MRFGTNTLTQAERWDQLFRLIRPISKSPFFSKAYYDSYSNVEQGEAQYFWAYKDENNYMFYPYLMRSINNLGYDLSDEYHDISGAYGYNGPIGVAEDSLFLDGFNKELQEHLRESNVVTEFVRYCPIIDNRRFHTYTKQFDVLDNVYIDLSRGLNHVWDESFSYRVRKTTRKGESYGLKTSLFRGSEIDEEHLQIFFEIYNSTMHRNNADSFYFFDFGFFQGLKENLGEMLLLSITFYQDTPISTELILLGDELAYGFLGGTLSEYYQYKANTFQRWELLKYLEPRGYKKYSMGGGASRNDSIYDFKMSFAKGCENPFFIGTHVHLPDVYADIQEQWRAKHPISAAKYGHMLQGYRKLDA
jgi:hypothetical protein